MNVKALQTLDQNSTEIASAGNGCNGIHGKTISLCRHKDGRHYLREYGGGAMDIDTHPQWISRDEAVRFVAEACTDCVTGYGYTTEQAEQMVDGIDAGKGESAVDDDLVYNWMTRF